MHKGRADGGYRQMVFNAIVVGIFIIDIIAVHQ